MIKRNTINPLAQVKVAVAESKHGKQARSTACQSANGPRSETAHKSLIQFELNFN